MGTGETNLWTSGLILVPVFLFATLGVMILLVLYWQKKTHQNLKGLRAELRRLQAARRQLGVQMAAHSPSDPEPFGSRMAALQKQLDDLDSQLMDMDVRHVEVHEGIRRISLNRFLALVGAPYFWYLFYRDTNALWKRVSGAQAALTAAGDFGQGFSRLGWEVAQEARGARDLQEQAARQLEQFRQRSLRGEAFEKAAAEEKAARLALDSLPGTFFAGEEAAVMAQAGKESIAAAHQVAGEVQPRLEALLSRLKGWEGEYTGAVEQVGAMRAALTAAEQALTGAPAGLDLTAAKGEFDRLDQIASTLNATLSRLEAESMPAVAAEAGRVAAAARALEGKIKQARQQMGALEAGLNEANEGLRQLSATFAELGKAQVHPLIWSRSRARLTTFSRQVNSIGPGRKPRQPEQVEADLAAATKLNAGLRELTTYCQTINQQHTELAGLLSGPDISQGRPWYQATLAQLQRVAAYDPENWPRADSVQTVKEELRLVDEGLRAVVSGDLADPIDELDVASNLEGARKLAQLIQGLKARVANITGRLAEIQAEEKQAAEALAAARRSFGQIALLVRSNSFLTDLAGQEVARQANTLQALATEIEDRSRGTVEKKSRQVATALGRVEQLANNWLEQLTHDIEAAIKELSDILTALDAIAQLDEPAVAEARRAVSNGQAYVGGGRGARAPYTLDGLVLELKRRCDAWQQAVAVINALEDLGGPVVESYNAARESRQAAKDHFAELASWLRSSKAWPPTTVTLTAEKQELDKLEQQWEGLKSQRARAISLVQQLGNFSTRYQILADKAHQAAENANKEKDQVEALENEIADLAQLWQDQWQAYRDNPRASEAIRRLISEVEREQGQIRQGYRQGSRNYGQIIQALQILKKKLSMAQVPVDEGHVMDVNGRVVAFR